jgi:hypothetical protein
MRESGESAHSTERAEVYSSPAVVERRLETVSVVRWQDNGTQGFVPTDDLEGGR